MSGASRKSFGGAPAGAYVPKYYVREEPNEGNSQQSVPTIAEPSAVGHLQQTTADDAALMTLTECKEKADKSRKRKEDMRA